MEHNLNLPNRFAMILDPETIEGALKRAAGWKLPRRECHPLDRRGGTCASVDLDRYDAAIEAAPVSDAESDLIDAICDGASADARAEIDIEDGEEFDQGY